MPLVNPAHNPIMCMQNEIEWLVTIQNILGVLTMALLMLIVRDDVGIFSLRTTKEKIFFALTVLMCLWLFHYIIYSTESGKAIIRWPERLRCFSFFIQ